MIMRKWIVSCLAAWLLPVASQAQTVKLPTKKVGVTTESPTKQEAAPTKPPKEKPVTPTENQGGTITLPTTKKGSGEETAPDAPATPVLAAGDNGTVKLPVTVRKRTAPRAKPIVKKPKKEDNEIYESAEHMPTYPGGVQELASFIAANMHYPEEAMADSIQDIVQVSFVVEKDGTPTEFEVIDDHHPALEAEAVRVLQQMPKWNPATQNGVKVRVEYVVPVKFSLSNPIKE